MRFLLQLLLLISVGGHAVWGCTPHQHGACDVTGGNHSAVAGVERDESSHSHGPRVPSGCCLCANDDCAWIVGAERTELHFDVTVHSLLESPPQNGSASQRRLAAADLSASHRSRPLYGWNCVWLI